MPDDDLQTLSGLPLELQLCIADAVGERCDRASLALASPLLGLAACRELPSYQGLEMSLAFHHVLGGAINEQLLRSYASRSEATLEGCKWLAGVRISTASGWRTALPPSGVRMEIRVVEGIIRERWYLVQWPDRTDGALLREISRPTPRAEERGVCRYSVTVCHYEGEEGAERLVRNESMATRARLHYTGEKGAERLVCCELLCGVVGHYEGEKGAERLVRINSEQL